MATEKKCCVFGGFCWKNPVHVAIGLAVLPFTVEGAKAVCVFVMNVIT